VEAFMTFIIDWCDVEKY